MLTFSDTDTLLPDEHTASLDPARAELITKHTSDIIQRFGLTTLMVTHNMQQAVDMGDRLIMMDKGEIILDVYGVEKSKLTVECHLKEFKYICGEQLIKLHKYLDYKWIIYNII